MSRIHEALKKAAEERAAVQSTLPADAPKAPYAGRIDGTSVGSPPRDVLSAPSAGDFLRFDDLRDRCSHPQWHLDPNTNVFFNPARRVGGAEQFRTLRSRLYHLRGNGEPRLRRILVTSAIPGEGKTFVANNLAQAIVQQPDRRVLLIDADLRSSSLHVPLGAPAAPGLTDYVRNEADEVAIIQHGKEANLCFIPGGNEVTNPSELLANARLKMLLDRVTPMFDWVILDSPPCLPVADANVVAEHCDGVLLVVRAGTTPSATAQRACQELKARNIVGVALNGLDGADAYGLYSYEGYASRYRDSDLKLVES
jgi:protein-tyrosine kinase